SRARPRRGPPPPADSPAAPPSARDPCVPRPSLSYETFRMKSRTVHDEDNAAAGFILTVPAQCFYSRSTKLLETFPQRLCRAPASRSRRAGVRVASDMTTSQLAVAIAKKYAGKTINWQVEAGTQSALWVSIQKLWQSETGTKLNVLATPYAEQFPKAVAAHQAGSGIDGLYVQYNWLPDF